jgi:microcystin degradation protein MlrC
MARTLRHEISPVQVAALVPVAINIERQHTAESPCAELEKAALNLSTRVPMLSSSILLGFPYADVPEMGSGAIVVADGSRAAACAGARELGSLLLDGRSKYVGKLIDPQAAIDLAAQLPGPVCLLDMGDNVGGGSPGDGTTLAHLLKKSAKRAFVCLYDPAAVDKAYLAGVGSHLTLEMGGHSGPPYGPPVSGRVHVKHLSDGRFVDMRPRHGGTTHYDIGKTAVVETPDGLTVMLTSRRSFPVSIVQLTSCGLDPTSFEIIVAKGVHAPVTAYAEACKTFLRVNTPGITAANMTDFSYRHRRRPLFPFEEPTDAIDRYIVEGNNRVG